MNPINYSLSSILIFLVIGGCPFIVSLILAEPKKGVNVIFGIKINSVLTSCNKQSVKMCSYSPVSTSG
jgi:hypothetical protein